MKNRVGAGLALLQGICQVNGMEAWTVIGPGALGTALGWALGSSNNPVNWVGRVAKQEPHGCWVQGELPLKSGGLAAREFVSLDEWAQGGPRRNAPQNFTERLTENVLVSVRAWQLDSLWEALRRRQASCVWLACNGLGIFEAAQRELGPQVKLGRMLAWFGARWEDPQQLQVSLGGGVEWSSLRAVFPAAAFEQVGWRTRSEADARVLEWRKVLWNASMNPVAALARVRNGETLERRELRAQVDALFDEAFDVALAEGVTLGERDALRAEVVQCIRRTGLNRNSLWVDLEKGGAHELAFLNGEIQRRARRLGIGVPAHDRIVEELITSWKIT